MMEAIEDEYIQSAFLFLSLTLLSGQYYIRTSREKSAEEQLELGLSLPCVTSTNTHLDPSPLRQWL